MAIITISRGSYSKGKEVAEKVADRLGYECISREVLLEASKRFNIPEMQLVRAIHDAPSILDRFQHSKQAYIAYIRSALTGQVKRDNIVYHGLAGHILLKGVPHVLKVRITANLEDRIRAEMNRESIGESEARELLFKDDQERRKWTKSLYGVDPWDSSLYDLVIRIYKLHVDDAVDLICQAVGREQFKTTDSSRHMMDDLAIACQVKAELVEQFFDVAVTSDYGNVIVYTKTQERLSHKLKVKVKGLEKEIEGINNLEVHGGVPYPPNAV
jgi:cytidylate kinase